MTLFIAIILLYVNELPAVWYIVAIFLWILHAAAKADSYDKILQIWKHIKWNE